jgi:predicted RNA-binding Zn ribbon-like protein
MTGPENLNNADDALIFIPRIEMSLDFANTLAYRGSTPSESLHNFDDLAKWCADGGVIPAGFASYLRAWSERHPKRMVEIFADAIILRELIYRIFHALGCGATLEDADLERLNRRLQNMPPRTAIHRRHDRFGWEVEKVKPFAELILAPVLWSAGDLLVGPQLARLRECLNDKCLWLFLDDSKNGTRRWCSMQACGNRAKAHRHYLRHKAS